MRDKKRKERERDTKRDSRGGGGVTMYGKDLSKHGFLLHPKSHRNFDPCVIKTKRTPATVSISG